jgi:hypothetical protein
MKAVLLVFVSILTFLFTAKSQITKGNWMIGGNAEFSRTNNTSTSTAFQKVTTVNISPAVGYFVIDKFAIGIRPGFEYQYSSTGISGVSNTLFNIGPYARYYFLPTENRINIFSEAMYILQIAKTANSSFGTTSGFKILAGPVVYLNNVIGIEFTLGYSSQQTLSKDGRINKLQTGIGLQIHLEKANE